MKKVLAVIILAVFVFSACNSDSTANYDDVINLVIEYNHELADDEDWNEFYYNRFYIERETSNFIIWKDGNNYYVMIRRNYSTDEYERSYCDAYKVGISNDRISSEREDRQSAMDFYEVNVETVYEETNIDLFEPDFESSQMRRSYVASSDYYTS